MLKKLHQQVLDMPKSMEEFMMKLKAPQKLGFTSLKMHTGGESRISDHVFSGSRFIYKVLTFLDKLPSSISEVMDHGAKAVGYSSMTGGFTERIDNKMSVKVKIGIDDPSLNCDISPIMEYSNHLIEVIITVRKENADTMDPYYAYVLI